MFHRKSARKTAPAGGVFAYSIAIAIPVLSALMVFGYSDQAPAWLRRAAVALWLIEETML